MKYIKNTYGSKKAFIKYYYYKLLLILGLFKYYNVKTQGRPKRLVFVCAGNICRSPIAEASAKELGFSAVSFGLDTRGGDNADARAIAYGHSRGLDLEYHKSQTPKDYQPVDGDLVVAMEPKHLAMYTKLGYQAPITMLGLYGNEPVPYIHDPYSSSDTYFNRCEGLILRKTADLIDYVTG